MQASNRVIFNTLIQYLRTVLSVFVSLYTTRLILNNLGVDDYGIYNLVGGLVSMMAFIKNSLAGTTQRYLSFHQGKKDVEMQRVVFSNSLTIQIVMGLALIVILLLCKPFFFGGFLNLPAGRESAASVVYLFMIGSLFFSMINVPFYADLIAHENIFYATIVSIVDSAIKIPIALSLTWFPVDKLELYAGLMFGLEVVNFSFYYIFCKIHYVETRNNKFLAFNKSVFKEMFSYMGWIMYGTGCIVSRTQGIAIALNKFLGAAINASYGIGLGMSGQLSFLSTSLNNAINPQIIKAEGAGNRKKMLRLSEISSKFSFLLVAMISIPAILEMDELLLIWLKKVPEHAVMFCDFVVLANMLEQLTVGLIAANKAIGNVRKYSITINTIKVLTLPAAVVCLWLELPVYSVMICYVGFELICALCRIPFLHVNGGLSIREYSINVFAKLIIPTSVTVAACLVYATYVSFPFSFLGTFVVSVATMAITAMFWGLCDDEKEVFANLFSKLINKRHGK